MLRESSRNAWMPGALASFEGRHGRSATPCLTEVVSWTARLLRVPEQGQSTGCHLVNALLIQKGNRLCPRHRKYSVVFNGGYCSGLPAVLTPAFRQSVILTAGKILSIETGPERRQTDQKRRFWRESADKNHPPCFRASLPAGSQIRLPPGTTLAHRGIIHFNEQIIVGHDLAGLVVIF